jgi:enterochelin esterase-like enzyme
MRQALERLERPPLREADFGGMVSPERLAELNRSLARRPFRGLIVLCPYLPDRFRGEGQIEDARAFGEILAARLLVRARLEIPGAGDAAGIDGVSLGGRAALLVGLSRPGDFAAVGALQPFIGARDTGLLVDLARRARAARSGLTLRLLSSDEDRFLGATQRLFAAWREAGIESRLDVVRGNHSYEFNQGPGVIEMLLFHDRALRGEPYLP